LNLTIGKQVYGDSGNEFLEGKLEIGGFSEDFHASTSYWDSEKYLSQWKQGLEYICAGSDKSAVITTMYNPATANFIYWWVMYRVGRDIYMQNHVLLMEELDEPFNENDFQVFVPDRQTVTEEGEVISEWKVCIDDVKQALAAFEN